MESLKNIILQKIKNKEISKKPRWFFAVKNSAFWVFWGVSVVIGSVSFAVIVFLVSDYDWDVYQKLNMSLPQHIITSLPYIWIALLGICLFLAYREFKNTKSGYRFAPYLIAGGSVFVGIIIGSAAYASGLGEKIDTVMSDSIPPYRQMVRTKMDLWKKPERGLIAGRIGTPIEDKIFEFTDLENARWRLDATRATWRFPTPLAPGMTVRIIGEEESPGMFRAKEIRPWKKTFSMEGMKESFPSPRNR